MSITNSGRTCTIGFFRVLIDYLDAQGVDTTPVFAASDILPEALNDLDHRITLRQMVSAFTVAEEITGDGNIGLHAGQMLKPGYFGVTGMLAMSCRNLGELIPIHMRFQSLVADTVQIAYENRGQTMLMKNHGYAPEVLETPHIQECGMVVVLTLVRWLTGRDVTPLRIGLMRAAPDDPGEHQRTFGCEIQFNCDEEFAECGSELFELPLPQGNPALRKMLEHQAEQMLLELGLNHDDPLEQTLQRYLIGALAQGQTSISEAAEAAGLSRRSLQRQLSARNTNFSQFLDTTRRALAEGYIRDSTISLTEIAFLLGFSEQSAFNRAFRRWTGLTPSAWRSDSS